jgi:hypothetical protein
MGDIDLGHFMTGIARSGGKCLYHIRGRSVQVRASV